MSPTVFKGKTLAVLLGGTAAERSVSLQSGENVATTLATTGAEVRRVDTADNGWQQQLKGVDFAFNLLHGPGGEDGTVQGFLEYEGIPYSGSGVLGSALTMDKARTKWLWAGIGLPTPEFLLLNRDSEWQAIIDALGPVFVKPTREGSSIGMSHAASASELADAYDNAASYGTAVMAEQYIEGSEYTVAILGDRALPSIRIETDAAFYDFEAKYVSEDTRFFCPSGLAEQDEAALAQLALDAFAATGASVWGRVDVLRRRNGDWQLLEVNTVPGMTSHSLVPMAAKQAGLSMAELLAAIYVSSSEECGVDRS
ncbi:D-alanine--D-alanine ligase [Luminiphilus syltensis NOR5-1B]|uniref:D-alanine--D-alanine ligase n=1 Tax=Luminiphilus syltensis NOR5-1B TaxID=565045 RepID=B8KR49_9GAMM|nr:D-alanine--D-alanine ligase [Luminiphilus syltensis]EED36033.1 D-alanine--D-alanine ligase [Luminiphilus syltensis NOR5-1B]